MSSTVFAPTARSRRAGFTLIELLVVLAILALLAGLVGPRVLSQLGGAKSKTAQVQIADLDKTLELFKLDVGRFPSPEEGLQALVAKPASVASGWNGPYLKGGVPNDPWGRAYKYGLKADGTTEIISLGADGAPGGDGENADLRNTR
ncbi:MAG: type II secretion system major pseudopilin GspG [Proteobacteria bacterium]|nr:type II secretion system major pseudopilin GspG [Pseudomonadota bacterium]